jgi:hypothetical protein
MKKLFQFKWVNFISYLIQVILFFVLCIYLLDPAHQPSPTMTDHGLGDGAAALGAIIIIVFLFILFLITCMLYLVWIRNTKAKKVFLVVINAIAFLLLSSQLYEAFPYLVKESKHGFFSIINQYQRNKVIVAKDDYQQIKFDGYKLGLFLCKNDTNLIYVHDTIKDSRKEKYYLVKGSKIIEIEKSKIEHFINEINNDGIVFGESGEVHPLVIIPENNQNNLVYGRTKLDFDDDPFNEENLPVVKIWNEFEDIKNAAELKGFKEFMPIEKSGKTDKNGTLYFLFWHLSNPGAGFAFSSCMDWEGNIYQNASLCLAVRKKGEKIMVREINLNALLSKERAVFYDCLAIEDFIVSGNYFYILVDGKLYFHKLEESH